MASEQGKARKALEEQKRKEEVDRIAAEQEFLELHKSTRRMSRTGTESSDQVDSETETERRKRSRSKVSPPKDGDKAAKSRRTEETEEETDVEVQDESDPIRSLMRVVKKMRNWFLQPTIMKMVTKPQTAKFERYFEEAEEYMIRAREERAALEAGRSERKALVNIVRETVQEELKKGGATEGGSRAVSYAEATGRKEVPKISGMKGPVLPPPKLVVIRQENKDSEEVKKKLKELVKPAEIGLKVRRLTKIRNGVIVEAETEEGVEGLLRNEALQNAGMKVGKPNPKKPVVMIYDVNSVLKDEEVKEEVYGRNMAESGIPVTEFVKEFEIKHKYKDGSGGKNAGQRNHLVVECSVRVRNWLRRKGRIFIEWESCRIKDYVDVARCYKCQRFGHVAKHCSGGKVSCSHCSGEHEYKDCKKKGKEEARCANCVRDGKKEVKHPASWRGCPAYEKAAKRYNEQIDYGV